jgi:O-acetyl-ADP-ribose deacetylase (regulator of RNase III)
MSDTLPFRAQINQTLVELWLGNIIDANTDAIVNAANTSLLGGGGVDGAIHRAAGPDLVAECRRYHGCKVGQAKITKGYKLKAAYVIHAVGPVYGTANDSDLLASAYRSSFQLAAQNPIKTIAFPAISTGAYQYPLDEAAEIALNVTYECVREKTQLEKVQFILFTQTALIAFARALKTLIDQHEDVRPLE